MRARAEREDPGLWIPHRARSSHRLRGPMAGRILATCFRSRMAFRRGASRSSTSRSSSPTSRSGSSTSCRPQPRGLPCVVLSRARSTAPATGPSRGATAGSPRCSCTGAGTTSSATCSSSRCSARTSRTRSGTSRYLALLLRRRLRGDVDPDGYDAARSATAADARTPNLGASGAIAAVLGAYFILYPNSTVLRADRLLPGPDLGLVLPRLLVPLPAVRGELRSLRRHAERRRRRLLRARRRLRLRRHSGSAARAGRSDHGTGTGVPLVGPA